MNESVTTSKKSRRRFDRAFKQQAVELWAQSNKSGAEMAAELGIEPNRLYAWRERLAPTAEELAAQNAALRREIENLRQQRDILKKTLGILSELPTSGTHGLTR